MATQTRSRFSQLFLDSQSQATEGAEDFTPAFQRRLSDEGEALIEQALAAGGRPSDAALRETRDRLDLLGAGFVRKAAVFENNARVGKLAGDLESGLAALAAIAAREASFQKNVALHNSS